MYAEINSIKSVAKAEVIFSALSASYTQRVGEKQAVHSDRMFQRACEFKVNGLAWWKARIRSVSHDLVSADSRVTHFIPASPETLAWGGFLGGERISYTNKSAEADAMEMIASRISAS
jgi:hypothetical protein